MSGRRTALGATALLGLGVLTPTATATAAAETCLGHKATIVGNEGRAVRGTEGRDVVVTNGATRVETFGGNDVVCISGERSAWIAVDTGAGDDFVSGTESSQPVFADLGTGQNGFAGGRGDDRISVDVTDGDLRGDALGGGRGRDALVLDTGAADLVIDNEIGVAKTGTRVLATFGALEDFWLQRSGARALTFVGSSADESVVDGGTGAGLLDVDLRGGRDSFESSTAPGAGSRIAGGDGRDRLEVASPDLDLSLDLAAEVLRVVAPTAYEVDAAQFEDANLYAPKVALSGTDGRNRLGLTACFGVISARAGDDQVRRQYDGTFETEPDCGRVVLRFEGGAGADVILGSAANDALTGGDGRDRVRGGSGNDRIVGGSGADVLSGMGGKDTLIGDAGNDLLHGGGGRDIAIGNAGRDRCLAERRTSCER